MAKEKSREQYYQDIINDPDYQKASIEDKQIVFARLVAKKPDFANAPAEEQQRIIQMFGISGADEQPREETQASQMATGEQLQAEQMASEEPSAKPTSLGDTTTLAGVAGGAKAIAETLLPRVSGVSSAEAARAAERFAIAQTRLREAQKAMAAGPAGQLGSVDELRQALAAAKADLDVARSELTAFQRAPEAAPKTAPEPSLAPTPDQQARGIQGTTKDTGITGRASQTTYNERTAQIARQRAAQQAVLERLQRQGLVDPSKAYQLTEGISGSTPSGVMVSPEEAARLEQELNQKKSQMAAEKARLGQRSQMLATQTREAERLARKVAEEEAKARVAQEAAQRAKAGKISPIAQVGSNIASSKILGPLLGVAGGVGTVMSVEEALRRYRAGDYSGAVLPTIEALFGGMSMMPPVTPLTAAMKGIGTVGGLGLGAYEMMKPEGGLSASYQYLKRKLFEKEKEKENQ